MSFEFSPHISVQVNSYDKALEFYQNILGMKLLKNSEGEAELEIGGMTFHIERSPQGHIFFEFKVENVESVRQKLLKEGCRATATHIQKSYLITDPYGMRFHIFEE